MSGYYDIAEVCLNGHLTNSSVREFPERNQKACSKCGAQTIQNCTACNTQLRGRYYVPGIFDMTNFGPIPAFCHNCGKPHPWTTKKIESFNTLMDETDNLKSEEKENLKKSVYDIISETPGTQLAVTRFKKVASKIGKNGMDLLVDLASETIKKMLTG